MDRVVLARKAPNTMVGYQWTGAEPAGMSELAQAEYMGATWEEDELVVYNFESFRHDWHHIQDGYLEDSD